MIEKIKTWIEGNKTLAMVIGAGVALLVLPKLMRTTRRRRVRRQYSPVRIVKVKNRPRRKVYTKGGKAKKPWQIKGSIAARRHMAKIRRMK
jgi:hypothetical protein